MANRIYTVFIYSIWLGRGISLTLIRINMTQTEGVIRVVGINMNQTESVKVELNHECNYGRMNFHFLS